MGGFGSGGWNRSGRLTTDDTPRLDVNYLNRVGALHVGCSSAVAWTQGGDQIARLNIIATNQRLELRYPAQTSSGQWHEHRQRVTLSWEGCRFGGRRPYFNCPRCGRRALHLYGAAQYLCRTCHGLSYPSQRERTLDRAQRKADRIRLKLGGKRGWTSIPARPKGMHTQTYERLTHQIQNADRLTSRAAEGILERIPHR